MLPVVGVVDVLAVQGGDAARGDVDDVEQGGVTVAAELLDCGLEQGLALADDTGRRVDDLDCAQD